MNFARVGVAPGSPRCYDDLSQLANYPIHLGGFADPTTDRHRDDDPLTTPLITQVRYVSQQIRGWSRNRDGAISPTDDTRVLVEARRPRGKIEK